MKRRKCKKVMTTCIIVVFLFSLFIYYIIIVNPLVRTYSKAQIDSMAEKVLNQAVSNVINTTLNYDSIININYSSTGEISYVNANQYSINTITREVVKNAQFLMSTIGEDAIKIPLGTFSGISLFGGRGPNVKLQMLPVGIVSSNFSSKFSTIGINNTLHQLFLNVEAKVELILPIKNITVKILQSVLLCEGIIVGKVPEVYFGSGNLGEIFDLTPQ